MTPRGDISPKYGIYTAKIRDNCTNNTQLNSSLQSTGKVRLNIGRIAVNEELAEIIAMCINPLTAIVP